MSLPSLYCQACQHNGTPGGGFFDGPSGPTDQVGFWCLECGAQVAVSVEWKNASFRDAVFSTLNPFEHAFPSLPERIARAVRPRTVMPGSVAESRAWVHARLDDGTTCPVCDQHAQRYKRTLNSGIARWLMVLARLSPRHSAKWVSTRDVICYAASLKTFGSSLGSGEAPSLLPFWDLIETRPNDDPSKRHSGFWRPTPKGHAFVAGEITVPRKVVVYNNGLERLEGPETSIKKALGKKFNYDELMSGAAA